MAVAVGCTGILGSFDVAPAGSGTDDGGGEGGMCTVCGADCVDLTTSSAHCGKCETACGNGQTCQASACACPSGQAFCDSKCVMADRLHCGASCTACLDDEICGTSCVAAPPPTFATTPLQSTGWTDVAGKALSFTLTPTGSPGTIYECRTGPVATFTAATPAFAPCDGATGTGTTHTPKPDAATPEGTYRTEYRYRSDTYRSPAVAYVYYAHHSLDGADTCPRAAHPEDGPAFTDDEFFAAAQAYSAAEAVKFPTNVMFPAPSNPPDRVNDKIFLGDPWIKIPFTAVTVTVHMQTTNGFLNCPPWPANGADYVFNERTLRHRYAMNPSRTMIIMRRQYVHPKTKLEDGGVLPDQGCKNPIRVGNRTSTGYGPADALRGRKVVDCEAIVVNAHGNGLCMGKDATGKIPVPVSIDQDPRPASTPLGSITCLATGVCTNQFPSQFAGHLNDYIELGNFGPWYKITALIDTTHIQVGPGPVEAVPAGTQALVSKELTPVLNVPTMYPKLHELSHGSADGLKLPGTPSPRTKCEAPGCNTGKPWLIYLPP
jgi:hypothetical protein